MKSVVWSGERYAIMENLRRREAKRQSEKGFSGLIVGTEGKLLEILDDVHRKKVEFTIAISQPGVFASRVSDDQLRLLAASGSYVRAFTAGRFEVYCSS